MNLGKFRKWIHIINSLPGGLDGFDHVPTVQHMLNQLRKALREDDALIQDLWLDARTTYLETFGEDRSLAKDWIEKLEQWLVERGEPTNSYLSI